jgi:hypothetical protein
VFLRMLLLQVVVEELDTAKFLIDPFLELSWLERMAFSAQLSK